MSETKAQVIVSMLAVGLIGMTASEFVTLPSWLMFLVVMCLFCGLGALTGNRN